MVTERDELAGFAVTAVAKAFWGCRGQYSAVCPNLAVID